MLILFAIQFATRTSDLKANSTAYDSPDSFGYYPGAVRRKQIWRLVDFDKEVILYSKTMCFVLVQRRRALSNSGPISRLAFIYCCVGQL